MEEPTIENRPVFSVRAGSEPAPQTTSLSQPLKRCTKADAALQAILDTQLQVKSAHRSKQLPYLLHVGHTPTLKRAKGTWLAHNRPTKVARRQRTALLPVGIHSTELNHSALCWADSINRCTTATAKARETAKHITIEQRFRSITGKHANALSFICMLLISLSVWFTLSTHTRIKQAVARQFPAI